MKSLDFRRYALGICAAAALLAGCGGSQPPIGALGSMPQSSAITTHADRGGSWMLPGVLSEDLLYVSNEQTGVAVFSYPEGKLVGSVGGGSLPVGLCSDKEGNVFIVDLGGQQILEYAHGGANPIATLDDTGNYPQGCFVDPKSHDLAVSGGINQVSPGNISIYADGSGSPKTFSDGGLPLVWCTYDGSGNIFASIGDTNYSGAVVELPKGSSRFNRISINAPLGVGGAVQWDGTYLDVGDPHGSTHGPTTIYQVQLSGSTGTLVNTIQLSTRRGNRNPGLGYQFWIQGHMIVSRERPRGGVGIWHFPDGGKPLENILDHGNVLGMTVSLAPGAKSRSIHKTKKLSR
jgi:hypothetical protein